MVPTPKKRPARGQPAQSLRVPKLCVHQRSGHCYTKVRGRQFWFGPHDDPQTDGRFRQFVAQWFANGHLPVVEPEQLTVADLAARHLTHAETYYRRVDGTPTGELSAIRSALRPLLELFSDLDASRFGIAQLDTVRNAMVQRGWVRSSINCQIFRIVRMYKWAAELRLVPPAMVVELRALRPLQRGRSRAKESPRREPVAWSVVEATLPHLGRQVAAMVLVMLHTAMRCGEVVQLATRYVDRSASTWVFTPPQHKGAHRGAVREIYLGPKAQAVVMPFLQLDPDRAWFRPCDAVADALAERRRQRKTPLWPSHVRHMVGKRKRKAGRSAGEQYDTRGVEHAIRRACDRAGVQRWTPHQLRHAALTRIRIERGAEAALLIGGHGSIEMTQLYTHQAERVMATKIISELG